MRPSIYWNMYRCDDLSDPTECPSWQGKYECKLQDLKSSIKERETGCDAVSSLVSHSENYTIRLALCL